MSAAKGRAAWALQSLAAGEHHACGHLHAHLHHFMEASQWVRKHQCCLHQPCLASSSEKQCSSHTETLPTRLQGPSRTLPAKGWSFILPVKTSLQWMHHSSLLSVRQTWAYTSTRPQPSAPRPCFWSHGTQVRQLGCLGQIRDSRSAGLQGNRLWHPKWPEAPRCRSTVKASNLCSEQSGFQPQHRHCCWTTGSFHVWGGGFNHTRPELKNISQDLGLFLPQPSSSPSPSPAKGCSCRRERDGARGSQMCILLIAHKY